MKQNNRIWLTAQSAEAAVLGGAVLGGGGGGAMEDGYALARLAIQMGDVELIPIDELSDEQILLTVSAVGAPAASAKYVRPAHFIRTVELFQRYFDIRPSGLITNECGGTATVNGWLQASVLGLALIDAPCNGRAHPTGIMGSIGLHQVSNYESKQIAVGGNPHTGHYLEASVIGTLDATARAVRNLSVQAGDLVAVARNPVTALYAKSNAAPGAIAQCIGLGEIMLAVSEKQPGITAALAADYLRGAILAQGIVTGVRLETKDGFDIGLVSVDSDNGRLELSFWNEYMTVEIDNQRLATFPDLIATIDAATGKPVATAEIQPGQSVSILHVPQNNLILGAGMRDPALLTVAEQAVGKQLIITM